MLEGLMKGLALWIYGLFLEIVEFIADSLLDVFNMDMTYFEANVPVTKEIVTIIIAAGWAILIGNLAFQALKSMMSGIGFEGEDPKILFCRTFVFSFLLVASRQICEIGLGLTAYLNTLLKTPNSVKLSLPPLDVFAIPGSWLLVIIIGLVLMFQIVKFFFEIAERYVVLVMLAILAPLAFGVGGSKNTEDIFKGWARMYGSACLMMLFNTVFLKLLLSAMDSIPSGPGMLPWLMLVVAIARVARKIDDIVARIGLNVARTGDPIGRGGIMYPIMVIRTLSQIIGKTAATGRSAPSSPGTGRRPGGGSADGGSAPHPPPPAPHSGGGAPSPGDSATRRRRNEQGYSDQTGAATGGAQPTASTTMPGGQGTSGKEPPPSRPPIGGGRDHVAPGRYDGTRDDTQAANNRRPPLSVDSGTPGSVSPGRTGTSTQESAVSSESGGRSPNMSRDNGRSGAPPLSVDSRKPDAPGASASSGAESAAPPKQRYRANRKVNIDIYRDDEPTGAVSSGAGVRGSRPVSAPGGASPPSAAPRAGGSMSGGKITHTQSRNNTENSTSTQNSVRNTMNGGNASAPPPGHTSSPTAGRVGRGVGTHGATVPGGAQRAPSERPGRQRPSAPASVQSGGSASANPQATRPTMRSGSSKTAPSGHGGNQSSTQQSARPSNSPPQAILSGQPPGARPMRYRMVNRDDLKKPGQTGASRPDSQAPARPTPGQPGYTGRTPSVNPPQGGEAKK